MMLRCCALALMLTTFLISHTGCTSSQALLPEPGTFAYRGDSVKEEGFWIVKSDNRIAIDKLKNPRVPYEAIIVFVDDAEVASASELGVSNNRSEIQKLVTEAAEDAVTSFGRFERTKSRDKAEIILKPSLYHASVWADTIATKTDHDVSWIEGRHLTGDDFRSINREAIDARCGIVLSYAHSGNEFAFRHALGRLVAQQGVVVSHGTYVVDQIQGSSKTIVHVEHPELKPTEFVRAIRIGIEGALAEILVAVEPRLWGPINEQGMRTSRLTSSNSPTVISAGE